MGFRFYKSFKLFPGVRLNLSKSGISAGVGIPGANINFSSRGKRTTFGIPGTGLSHITQEKYPSGSSHQTTIDEPVVYHEYAPELSVNVFDQPTPRQIQSGSIDELSSSGLEQLVESTKQLVKQRGEIGVHIQRLSINLGVVATKLKKKKTSLFRYFFRNSIAKLSTHECQLSADLSDHKTWLSNSKIELQFSSPPNIKTNYGHVVRAFENLCNCECVWDITADEAINKVRTRSAADKSLFRKRVSLSFSETDLFSFPGKSMLFENANGEDLHILQEIVFMLREDSQIALIEIKDIELEYSTTNFIEEAEIPADSQIVGKTWAKVNKNGKPDLRFNDNYEIPICRYGEILFKTRTGLFELYQFSNAQAAKDYVLAMTNYINSIRSFMNYFPEYLR